MKTLNLEQMESVQGGRASWSWGGCARTAVMFTSGAVGWIGVMSGIGLGGFALAGSLAFGCVAGGLA